MNLNNKGWGRIILATRLEKMIENQFFCDWSHLIHRGIRDGLIEKHKALSEIRSQSIDLFENQEPMDLVKLFQEHIEPAFQFKPDSFMIAKDRTAHQAANEIARLFVQSDFDTVCYLDSDASVAPGFLEALRTLEEGFEYDCLQAFYTRRGWPPEAIWHTKTALGDIQQVIVWDDDYTGEVSLVGLHATLIRREVFQAMLDERPEIPVNEFDFFFYPRHIKQSEDSAFSIEAARLGFKLGATTSVKTGHLSRVTTGWETFQEHLELSGVNRRYAEYYELVDLIAEFTGEEPDMVHAKAARGPKNVQESFEKHKPKTAKQYREFYGADDNGYLYELLTWNFGAGYQKTIAPLKKIEDQFVLVIGAGLGGEVEALRNEDETNRIVAFELPGKLREFLDHRYGFYSEIELQNGFDNLVDLAKAEKKTNKKVKGRRLPDLIVAIDTIEHFHPDEFEETMDAMFSMLAEDGEFYFRNNFGEQDKYPMHFDHSQAYNDWLDKNNLEIYRTVPEVDGQFIRRKSDE